MPGTNYTVNANAPSLATFCRVEPRAVDTQLTNSFQISVHDALWMITQQWRMGEFLATDGGSAIKVRVNAKNSEINRFKSFRAEEVVQYKHDKPLEAYVENLNLIPDLLLRLQLGRQFLKMLKKQQSSTAHFDLLREEFPISLSDITTNDHYTKSNKELMGLLTTVNDKVLDGYALYDHIKINIANLFVGTTLSGLTPTEKGPVELAALAFRTWFTETYSVPGENNCWSESGLEYQFKISAPDTTSSSGTQTVLHADSYRRGQLDWYDFDLSNLSSEQLSETGEPIQSNVENKVTSYLPTTIEFKGMPVSRWWEFEDSDLDFGNFVVFSQDMLKMMLMDFGLIYSNDWMIVPHRVKAGSICEIKQLHVTDVFGKHTLVKAAGSGIDDAWQRWAMFNLNVKGEDVNPADTRLYVAPSVGHRMESEPTEKVVFLKDEMANMVWGIEERVPDGISGGKEGKLAELELHNYFMTQTLTSPNPTLQPTETQLTYRFSNALPEYWIPFIPVKHIANPPDGRPIKYQRATFNRVVGNIATVDPVSARTSIIRPFVNSPYYINEEEILKAGVVVETNYQRTRWYDGKVVTWLGRSRTSGRGEGRSGLAFDQITTKT
jgi:hypothetical protein